MNNIISEMNRVIVGMNRVIVGMNSMGETNANFDTFR